MRATVEVLPESDATTGMPLARRPDAMLPLKPRKSADGRLTHCTGRRKGRSSSRWTSMVSRISISGGPPYQGVFSPAAKTLSPRRAESGTARMSGDAELAGKAGVVGGDVVEDLPVPSRQGPSC